MKMNVSFIFVSVACFRKYMPQQLVRMSHGPLPRPLQTGPRQAKADGGKSKTGPGQAKDSPRHARDRPEHAQDWPQTGPRCDHSCTPVAPARSSAACRCFYRTLSQLTEMSDPHQLRRRYQLPSRSGQKQVVSFEPISCRM